MQQIPEEGKLFQTVDKNWKEVMRHCVKDPKVKITVFKKMKENVRHTVIFLPDNI